MKKQNILVAYDFTKASDNAVEHALMTAKRFGVEVHLVHIIEDSKDIEKIEKKFKKIPNYDNVICHVRIGDVFRDIVNFSHEIHSKYTFLGIHNLSIWQKYITGSDVFKILNSDEDNSNSPFILVQEGEVKPYSKILVPIDGGDATKQKLLHVTRIAKNFQSEVVILLKSGIPENKFSKKFIKKFFNEYSIQHTFETRDEDFDKSILSVAKESNCNMIAIVNETENSFLPVYFSDEQEIILNELRIPVLVVNPIKRFTSYWD
jgi:nucleotide-binding universal stress UspA family protein